jgi:lipopolysaccharide/colanic/teichoic acid biosynthesis glycosyltransferase
VPEAPATRRRPRAGGPAPAVLDEELFSRLLVRERKRSERSGRPFMLLRLGAREPLDPRSVKGSMVLSALAAATRRTDMVGWLDCPHVVGVILTEAGGRDRTAALRAVRTRVSREIARRLGLQAVRDFSVDLRVYPDAAGIDPVLHPDLGREQRARWLSDGMKRALDVAGSAGLLLALSPLLLVAAAAIRLTSPGPVLFRQTRVGQMGRPFTILKFRSMFVDADERSHREFITRFIQDSQKNTLPKNSIFKLTNDPRVTPVGRVIRKTSIDELPQLWNVLTGDMSLVGPRPPLPYEFEQYAPWHRRRVVEAKPGVTGLWQVTGRSRTSFDEMVRLDLRYSRTKSFWTDIRILLRTPKAVFSGRGAH